MKKATIAFVLVILVLVELAQAAIRHVPGNYPTIQAAIDNCNFFDIVVVEPNTYTGPGNRDIDFKGKAITVKSTDPNDPCVVAATIIDCNGTRDEPHRGFRFVTNEGSASRLAGITVIRGYPPREVIDTPLYYRGGAIFCTNSSPTLTNCVFTNNGGTYGGGMYNGSGSPVLTKCVFSNNSGTWGGGLRNDSGSVTLTDCNFIGNSSSYVGGAIDNYEGGNVTIETGYFVDNTADWGGAIRNYGGTLNLADCTFADNRAEIQGSGSGGGIETSYGAMVLTNCTFSGNFAGYNGGGIESSSGSATLTNCRFIGNTGANGLGGAGVYNGSISMTLVNCVFVGNTTGGDGGGLFNYNCSPTLTNCTFRNNAASGDGGGIHNLFNCSPVLTNCILWDNSDSSGTGVSAQIYSGNPVVTYSCVNGWTGGTGNINVDPLLAFGDENYLSPGSPCIDAGDNTVVPPSVFLDPAGNPRFLDDPNTVDSGNGAPPVVDMGAYEYDDQFPYLGVSDHEIEFTVFEGKPNSQEHTLYVYNVSGGGVVDWEISIPAGCDWLSVSPTTGSSTGDFNEVLLSVDNSGLPSGQYTCELTVSDSNALSSPQPIEVTMTVVGPVISLSPEDFDFLIPVWEPNESDQILSIQNAAGGRLDWQISFVDDCNWLTVHPMTGQSSGEVNEVILSVDSNGLDLGVYECALMVSDPNAENSPQTVAVYLHIFTDELLLVPTSFPTIQAAVDVAVAGNQVVVEPGVHSGPGNVDVDFQGKAITIRSIDPCDPHIVADTIIDLDIGEGGDYGFRFDNGEGPDSVVAGLTITGARGAAGVGICNASPTIRNCIIRDNGGNGIHGYVMGDMTVSGCVISRNFGIEMGGGGIAIGGTGSITISDCVISENEGSWDGGGGIGYHWWGGEDPPLTIVIVDSVISENTSRQGGGVYISDGACEIIGCIIKDNSVPENGGGVCFGESVNVIIADSRITDNSAGVDGGGGYFGEHDELTITNSIVLGNSAGEEGGGLYFGYTSSSTIIGCRISNNRATWTGGGIGNRGGPNQEIVNCVLSGNVAFDGGAMGSSLGTISNSTIVGNRSMYTFSGRAGTRISNSIVWDNLTDHEEVFRTDPCYTCIEGGYTGTGNIDVDPCFAVPGYWHPNETPTDANDDYWVEGDYHLKSEAGRWEPSIYAKVDQGDDGFINLKEYALLARDWQKKGGFLPGDLDYSGKVDVNDLAILLDGYMSGYAEGQWVFDDVNSLCIDGGDPNSDWTEELWPNGGRINTGAYGGTSEASMSLNNVGNIADLNHDDVVNFEDFGRFGRLWKIEQVLLAEDFDRNGSVDGVDMGIFVEQWLWRE